MIVFNSIEEYSCDSETIVALGNFEGVHIGHAKILRKAVEEARARGLKSVCYTFSNHPRNLNYEGKPGRRPDVRMICTEEDKLALIEELGIDICCNFIFDKTVMKTPAEDFVRDLLVGKFHAAGTVCGFNYRFGSKAAGDVKLLAEMGRELGFEAFVCDPVTIDGKVVSSTAIRELIDKGDMELCARYLGRPYSMSGEVVSGNRLGRRIGFPTANFLAGDIMQLPPNGVYYSHLIVDGVKYNSVTNIGTKPTIGDSAKSVETNILDFSGNLYGKKVTVDMLYWSRPEKKFDTIDELEAQIGRDAAGAREYHATHVG